jgi:transketolase
MAWRIAYERIDGPTVLALTRQGLPVFPKADPEWKANIRRGAYVAKDCKGAPDIVVVATGSEVHAALKAAEGLADRKIRVVSMVSRELFLSQPASWRAALVPAKARKVVFEAQVTFGWTSPFDDSVVAVGIDRFGESGPYQKLAERFGITAAALTEKLKALK